MYVDLNLLLRQGAVLFERIARALGSGRGLGDAHGVGRLEVDRCGSQRVDGVVIDFLDVDAGGSASCDNG